MAALRQPVVPLRGLVVPLRGLAVPLRRLVVQLRRLPFKAAKLPSCRSCGGQRLAADRCPFPSQKYSAKRQSHTTPPAIIPMCARRRRAVRACIVLLPRTTWRLLLDFAAVDLCYGLRARHAWPPAALFVLLREIGIRSMFPPFDLEPHSTNSLHVRVAHHGNVPYLE